MLYAKRDATEQLRKIHGVSIEKLEKERQDDLYIVTAYARDAAGRTDASTGVVSLKGLSGESLANAIMKGETKAKRRVTLSICGLGLLDETEIDSIPRTEVTVVTEKKVEAPVNFDGWWTDMQALADNGIDALKEAWSKSPLPLRSYLTTTDSAAWEALKAKAAAVRVEVSA